ncbi:MAG: hypothetical protein RH982_10980 [Parvibaculum sp.]
MTDALAVRGSPSLVAVLGMHRAGTSLLTNVLSELTGGTDGHYLVSNEYNAKGYWEDAEVVAIHNSVLGKIKREWGSVRSSFPYPSQWWDSGSLASERAQLKSVIEARTAAAAARGQPWIVKDPRMSRLFPLWKSLVSELDVEAHAVLALRHPDAVAASLERRDKFPPTLSHTLWLMHYVDAVLDAGGHIRLVLPYDDWFVNPTDAVRKIVSCLGLDVSGSEDLAASIAEPGLRHHAGNGASTPTLDTIFKELCAWPAGEDVPRGLLDIASGIRATLDTFRAWQLAEEDDHYFDDARRLDTERTNQLLAASEEKLRVEHQEHRRAAKTIEMRDTQIAALEAEKAEAMRVIGELEDMLFAEREDLADAKRLLELYAGRETPLFAKLARVLHGHFRRG